MPDYGQFWDWFSETYGEELKDQWYMTWLKTPGLFNVALPTGLQPYFEHWKTNIAPKAKVPKQPTPGEWLRQFMESEQEEEEAEQKDIVMYQGEKMPRAQATMLAKQEEQFAIAKSVAERIEREQEEKQRPIKEHAAWEERIRKLPPSLTREEEETIIGPEPYVEKRIPKAAEVMTIPALQLIKNEPNLWRVYQQAKQYGIDTSQIESIQFQWGSGGEEGIISDVMALQKQVTSKQEEWERLKKEAKVTPMSRGRPQRIARI